MLVRRHRKRHPGWILGWGAVATAVLWAVAVYVQPPPLWRPGQGVPPLAASAVFRQLDQLGAGDLIEVQRDGVWLKFTVVSTGRYPKSAFPTAQVYGPTPDAQLRVITCGGTFDRAQNSYRDNVVVFAIMRGNGY
jgi:sortase family protein